MPVFDYQCPSCLEKRIDVFVHRFDEDVLCSKCRKSMVRLFATSSKFIAAKVFPSDGVFLKNVSSTGKRFFSEKEMRQWEKDHNQELGYLL